MEDLPAVTKWFNRGRLHQATALCRSVARMNIDMLAIQTTRTMIGIAAPGDFERTLSAYKILRAPLKAFGR